MNSAFSLEEFHGSSGTGPVDCVDIGGQPLSPCAYVTWSTGTGLGDRVGDLGALSLVV